MSVRTTVQTVAYQGTEGRATRFVEPIIHLLEPDKYPITILLTKAEGRLKSAGNVKVEILEDELPQMFDVLSADHVSGAGTLIVTNYTYFVPNMVVRVNKAELFRVLTANSTTLTVEHVGETSARAASLGDSVEILGEAYEEGSPIGSILCTVKTNPYNYMDITRTQFGWTGRAMESDVYGQSDPEYDRYKKMIEHCRTIEKKLIMSERTTATGGVHSLALTTMRGILAWLSSNNTDCSGTLTEDLMDDICLKGFRYGSKKKILVACGHMINAINGFAKQRLKASTLDTRYGLKLEQYINAFGTLDLIYHPELANSDIDDTSGLGGTGIILDIGNMNMWHMPNRYMVLNTNVETPGDDLKKEEFLSDCTITLALEKEHVKITGAAK